MCVTKKGKKMNARRELWLLLAGLMLGSAAFAETKVEVTLVDRLDEPRGFCFDTLGFQAQARPEEGLQTHSCYSYQGQLAVDQAFDGDLIPEGTFKLIEFDLCMTLTGTSTGSTLPWNPATVASFSDSSTEPTVKSLRWRHQATVSPPEKARVGMAGAVTPCTSSAI